MKAPPEADHRPRTSVAAEALGYAGGGLVIVGTGLVVARTWESLGTAGRVGVLGGAGALVGLIAWRVPSSDGGFASTERLKGTLWLVATVALSLAAGVGVHDVLEFTSPQAVVSTGAAVGLGVSIAVWRGRSRPVQQATTWLAAALCVGALGGHLSDPGGSGLAATLVGLAVVIIGLRGLTQPSVVAVWCGGAILLVSSQMLSEQWRSAGLLFSVAVASTLVGLAVLPRPVVTRHHVVACAVTGGILLVRSLPPAIGYHAERAGLLTGVVVWLAALALMWWASPPHALRAPVPVWVTSAVLFVLGPAVAAGDQETPALIAGVAASAGVIAVGVVRSSVPPTLVGALGLSVFVPWSVARLMPGAVAAPLAIVLVGLIIVAVALWLVRRRQVTREDSEASTPSSRAPGAVG